MGELAFLRRQALCVVKKLQDFCHKPGLSGFLRESTGVTSR